MTTNNCPTCGHRPQGAHPLADAMYSALQATGRPMTIEELAEIAGVPEAWIATRAMVSRRPYGFRRVDMHHIALEQQ